MLSLQQFLETLTFNDNINICIHDISGILSTLQISTDFKVHNIDFCANIKNFPKGLDTCLWHKDKLNLQLKNTKCYCVDVCPYGKQQVVYPVIISGDVKAVIYVSSNDNNMEICLNIARLTDSYIGMLFESNPGPQKNDESWVITMLKEDAENYYSGTITLQSEAKRYFYNEKYLGRLFKKETGTTFSKYLNSVRLTKAEKLLLCTKEKVTSVSEACGYENATHFNRVFKKRYGLTPSEYRKKHL